MSPEYLPNPKKFPPALWTAAQQARLLTEGNPTLGSSTLNALVNSAHGTRDDFLFTSREVARLYVDTVLRGDEVARSARPELANLARELDALTPGPFSDFLVAPLGGCKSRSALRLRRLLEEYSPSDEISLPERLRSAISFSDFSPPFQQGDYGAAEAALGRACLLADQAGNEMHAEAFAKYSASLRVNARSAFPLQAPTPATLEEAEGRCIMITEELTPLISLSQILELQARRYHKDSENAFLASLTAALKALWQLSDSADTRQPLTLWRRNEVLERWAEVVTPEAQCEFNIGPITQAAQPIGELLDKQPYLAVGDIAHFLLATRKLPPELGGGNYFEGVRLWLREAARELNIQIEPDPAGY